MNEGCLVDLLGCWVQPTAVRHYCRTATDPSWRARTNRPIRSRSLSPFFEWNPAGVPPFHGASSSIPESADLTVEAMVLVIAAAAQSYRSHSH